MGATVQPFENARVRFARTALLALATAFAGLASSGCIFSRMFYYNTPSLSAPADFDSRPVAASQAPVPLEITSADKEPAFRLTPSERHSHPTFDALLEANDTRALVVVHDDRVVYERYFGDTNANTLLPGFSVTKTIAAMVIGCALRDGIFTSTNEKIATLIPELAAKSGYRDITVDHLLRMTAGLDFEEESIPGAMFYYSQDLRSRLFLYDVKWAPGTHYLYGSISTQLLWEALHRRLGGRTVSSYFQERLWSPLGATHDAAWMLDSSEMGVEKFFAGFSATARDHARFGMMYLHGGTFAGRTVLPSEWVSESLEPDPIPGVVQTTDGAVRRGKYQWFLTLDGRAYFAKGYHGQYIFVVPSKKLVFVRFGDGYGDVNWPSLFLRMADAFEKPSNDGTPDRGH